MSFGEGPSLTDTQRAVHEIRADETLALRARISALEAALKPFANAAKNISDDCSNEMLLRGGFSVRYFRNALSALEDDGITEKENQELREITRDALGDKKMTDDNVITFNKPTYLDLHPDKVLEAAKGQLEGVVIMGYDECGGEYFASSYASRERMLWLAERLKVRLMEEDNG